MISHGLPEAEFSVANAYLRGGQGRNLPKAGEIRLWEAKFCEISAIFGVFRVAFFGVETLIIKSTLSDGQTFPF
jgi:hypothetical protein